MGSEWVALAQVVSAGGKVTGTLVYDFGEESLEVVEQVLPEETRFSRGFAVAGWTAKQTFELVNSLPLGSVGECYVEELHGVEAEVTESGIFVRLGERVLGRLVNRAMLEHWKRRDAEQIKAKVRMIGAGTMRVVHDGEGQVFRLIKSLRKPDYRKRASP